MNPLPSKEKSEKAQTVEKILSKMEKAAPYAALMTVLLGEPVEAVSKKVDVAFASGVAVVPLSNAANSHNYPIGHPAVHRRMTGTAIQFVMLGGLNGNNMTSASNELRMATDAEVEDFVKKLSDIDIAKFAVDLLTYPIED